MTYQCFVSSHSQYSFASSQDGMLQRATWFWSYCWLHPCYQIGICEVWPSLPEPGNLRSPVGSHCIARTVDTAHMFFNSRISASPLQKMCISCRYTTWYVLIMIDYSMEAVRSMFEHFLLLCTFCNTFWTREAQQHMHRQSFMHSSWVFCRAHDTEALLKAPWDVHTWYTGVCSLFEVAEHQVRQRTRELESIGTLQLGSQAKERAQMHRQLQKYQACRLRPWWLFELLQSAQKLYNLQHRRRPCANWFVQSAGVSRGGA